MSANAGPTVAGFAIRSLYRPAELRDIAEQFCSKIKHYRTIATGYGKHSEEYIAVVKRAAAGIQMNIYKCRAWFGYIAFHDSTDRV